MGFETPEEGYLAKIIVPAGTKNISIGKLVCIIVSDEGSVSAFKDFKDDGTGATPAPAAPAAAAPSPAPAAAPPRPASAPPPSSAPISSGAQGDRVFVTPLARRIASEQGLNLTVSQSVYTFIFWGTLEVFEQRFGKSIFISNFMEDICRS